MFSSANEIKLPCEAAVQVKGSNISKVPGVLTNCYYFPLLQMDKLRPQALEMCSDRCAGPPLQLPGSRASVFSRPLFCHFLLEVTPPLFLPATSQESARTQPAQEALTGVSLLFSLSFFKTACDFAFV